MKIISIEVITKRPESGTDQITIISDLPHPMQPIENLSLTFEAPNGFGLSYVVSAFKRDAEEAMKDGTVLMITVNDVERKEQRKRAVIEDNRLDVKRK